MTLDISPTFTWNETVWNPSMIQTALWLDAADASTITESSGLVSQWSDKSGNLRHVFQATPILRPTYSSAVLNSLPVIRFDGSNDRLETSAALLTQQTFGIYAITANRNPAGESAVMGQYIGGDVGRTLFYQNGITTRLGAIFSGQGNAIYNGTANSQFHIFGYEGNNVSYTLHYEGASVATGSIAGSSISNTTFKIGEPAAGAGSNFFPAALDAAEIVITLAPLSGADRQKLEGYLAHKWGLDANLPADHPYKNYGPRP